jgi:Cell wall binding domain 2 (CWB2)
MPAAAWAAKSGDSLLFTEPDKVPESTRRALERRDEPNIYVLGPPSVVGESVLRSLSRLGRVRRIAGRAPVENAIAFARYSDGAFGWGVRDPGHGLVFANESRPLDAVAGAPLGASGTYGPLLLTNSATALPAPLRDYLLDIQPGYSSDPVRGVYNHAWLLGDESAIGAAMQDEIDELTEIVRVKVEQTQ